MKTAHIEEEEEAEVERSRQLEKRIKGEKNQREIEKE